MHFTSLGSYATRDVPVMARGKGCYVYDASGKLLSETTFYSSYRGEMRVIRVGTKRRPKDVQTGTTTTETTTTTKTKTTTTTTTPRP